MAGRYRIAARACTALVATVTLVSACSSDTKKSTTSTDAFSSIKVVDMRGKATAGQYPEVGVDVEDNKFAPQGVRVDVGVTVVFTNHGRSVHNLLPVDEQQTFGNKTFGTSKLEHDAKYSYRFSTPGVYRIFCSLHGSKHKGMVGEIVVGDVDVKTGVAQGGSGLKSGTLRVPQDYDTIQAAVDASKPGALILVDKGVYHEAVTVDPPHENIVIRGVDRNKVIVDGQFDEKKPNGFLVQANGVAIENLTARNYTTNAFFWRGVKGYRGSYLNSYRTGDYGIYAFDSTDGQFDHNHALGSRDAGYYIGQCFKCNAVVTDSVSEWNGLGYSGTNAGGDLYLINSVWRNNRAGIVPNSGTGEGLYPQHGTTIVGNTVYSNNNAKTPAISIAEVAYGNGILLAGGNENEVMRNLVYDHNVAGIAAIPLPEKLLDTENTKAINFDSERNNVHDNVISDSRVADLVLLAFIDPAKDHDNGCNDFKHNTFSTSLPADIEKVTPCKTATAQYIAPLAKFIQLFTAKNPPEVNYQTAPLPAIGDEAQMPNALTAPAVPAKAGVVPMKVDISKITTPTK